MKLPQIYQLFPYLVGYTISLFVAHFFIRWTTDPLWYSINEERKKEWLLASLNQGFIERMLYTLSWQFDQPAFIGIWLALKAASQWKKWSETPSYNIFLVGTGLSVIYSVIGANVISWIQQSCSEAVTVPIVIILLNLILIWFNHQKAKK